MGSAEWGRGEEEQPISKDESQEQRVPPRKKMEKKTIVISGYEKG
jgi:hypothetical protein